MKVKFLPQEVEFEIEKDQTILDLAEQKGLFIKSVCRGVPNCAECRVKVVEGEYNLLPPSKKETALIGTAHFIDGRRLSCQLICFGDVTIDLSEQVEKSKKEHKFKRQKEGVTKDENESKALSGNLIDEDKDLLIETTKEVDERVRDTKESSGGALKDLKIHKKNESKSRNHQKRHSRKEGESKEGSEEQKRDSRKKRRKPGNKNSHQKRDSHKEGEFKNKGEGNKRFNKNRNNKNRNNKNKNNKSD